MIRILAFLLFVTPALADDWIIGRATVVDGDTIAIRGQRIRLLNMDAPESDQLCFDPKPWRCGQRASLALADFIGRQTVTCDPRGKGFYRRTLAHCYVDGIDVGAWMVRNGWAVAFVRYGREYLPQERRARGRKAGMWRGTAIDPTKYRRCRKASGKIMECSKNM
ncbi:MAG: thermonuclease family protein [Beijerinckiaceae bacterium]